MSKDEKIAKALAKQGEQGSPYANERNMAMDRIPLGGVQVDWKLSKEQEGLKKMQDALNKVKAHNDRIFKVDNLIFPNFKKNDNRKKVLVVNHETGKITSGYADEE